MKQLDNISLSNAKNLLREMKSYVDMTKKLGHRGRDLFMKNLLQVKSYTVEYFPALGMDTAWIQAQSVFKKSF